MAHLLEQIQRGKEYVEKTKSKPITITEIEREQMESRVDVAGIRYDEKSNEVIIDRSDKREVLRPYQNKRLGFEGVLIHVIEPSWKNHHTYGLVFASVYAPTEKIELDHVVIQLSRAEFNQANLEWYTRYYFTAEVTKYYKTAHILGIAAKQENFMLQYLNIYKMHEIRTSRMSQPTAYTINRIRNVLKSKAIVPRHTEEELLNIVSKLPNDGSVERFIDKYTESYQNVKVSKFDVENVLYTPAE